MADLNLITEKSISKKIEVTAPRDKSRGFTAPAVPDLDNHRGRIVAVVDF
jgi:hypothetical protein